MFVCLPHWDSKITDSPSTFLIQCTCIRRIPRWDPKISDDPSTLYLQCACVQRIPRWDPNQMRAGCFVL